MAAPHFKLSAMVAKRKQRSAPAGPPPGVYDPNLDAQGRQLQRSYNDSTQDYGVNKTRAQDDLIAAMSQLGQSKDRSLADILTSKTRAGENHAQDLANLGHSYGVLAERQAEHANQANVISPGILAQAIAHRQASQARAQAPLDTNYARSLQDLSTSQDRVGQDYSTNASRMALGFDRSYGLQGDATIGLARQGRDLTAGKLDLNNSKWYQAAALGYSPPTQRRRKTVVI